MKAKRNKNSIWPGKIAIQPRFHYHILKQPHYKFWSYILELSFSTIKKTKTLKETLKNNQNTTSVLRNLWNFKTNPTCAASCVARTPTPNSLHLECYVI